jgi:hypothetical protein
MTMLQVLLTAALLLAQDPKPAKTVEERLKELEEKLAALEKKHKALRDENAAMEISIVEAKAWKESFARQTATAWVKQYAAAVQFSEKQSSELETLWYDWTKEDQEKGITPGRWTSREQVLRSKLSPEQAELLARKVRADREQNVRATVAGFARSARLTQDKIGALQNAVMSKLKIDEGPLILQAHGQEMSDTWGRMYSALEGGLSDVSSTLTEDELRALRKILEQWKPLKR